MNNNFGPQNESEKRIFAEENARVDFQYELNKLINQAKISRQELANKVGISIEEMNRFFEEDADPGIKVVAALFQALGANLILTWERSEE